MTSQLKTGMDCLHGIVRQYHPDTEINAEIIEQALEAETSDLKAGYPSRWWVCPVCETPHNRGHFGTVGSHRCWKCGYAGGEGTMHTNNPIPYLPNDQMRDG